MRQLIGSNSNVPPTGVSFGSAQVGFASQWGGNATGWLWNNSTSAPCSEPGIFFNNGTYLGPQNSSANTTDLVADNTTTTVCLNSVFNGTLNATWYNSTNGTATQLTFNTYNVTSGVVNSSYYYDALSGQNVSACTNWTMWHDLNTTYNNGTLYLPCTTYFEMNNNTTFLSSFDGFWFNDTTYNNSTLWSPGQMGYLASDLIYTVPVIFTNASQNATYAISIAIEGITPVAQTFYFNGTGSSAVGNATVLFSFDMTAAWLMDLTFNNTTTLFNVNESTIYASVGVVSAIVTECAITTAGLAVCPIAVPQQ